MVPKVSVIIPTFNRSNLVGKAIQSVLEQTFQDFEVIVVDDGSGDNTREVVSKFGEKVIYIYQENKERSAARNNGMKHARGQFIAFLDSDDLFLPDKLMIQVELMERNPDYGMSYSYSVWLGEKGRYLHTWRDNLSGRIFPEMMMARHNKITVPSVMIRKGILDVVGYFNENINTCEDYEFWCRIGMKYPILLIKKGLVVINTSSEPSDELFYSYFTSTLSYFKLIFNLSGNVKRSDQKAIMLDLSAKYYINAIKPCQRDFVLSEIKKINPSYALITLKKVYAFYIIRILKKFNGISTILKFLKLYVLIRLPRKIFSEDIEYGILGVVQGKDNNLIADFYRKDFSGNIYFLKQNVDRKTRKRIRDLLIYCNYLSENRIAMVLKPNRVAGSVL